MHLVQDSVFMLSFSRAIQYNNVTFRKYVSDEVLIFAAMNTPVGGPGADLRKKLTKRLNT